LGKPGVQFFHEKAAGSPPGSAHKRCGGRLASTNGGAGLRGSRTQPSKVPGGEDGSNTGGDRETHGASGGGLFRGEDGAWELRGWYRPRGGGE